MDGSLVKEKIQAIVEMKKPESKKDSQILLGMINYLGKFILNLRQFLEKNVKWHWTGAHQHAFEEFKCAITSASVLKYYDVSAPVKISADCGTGSMSFTRQSTNCIYISLNSAEQNQLKLKKNYLLLCLDSSNFKWWT